MKFLLSITSCLAVVSISLLSFGSASLEPFEFMNRTIIPLNYTYNGPLVRVEIIDYANMTHDEILSRITRNANKKKTKKTTKAKKKAKCTCGIKKKTTQSKIVGGQESQVHWPWMVSLALYRDGGVAPFCGGSLITPTKVITAAHCLPGMEGTVLAMVGAIKIQEITVASAVSSATGHPDYGKGHPQDNDIAILTLSEPIKYTKEVGPICLSQGGAPWAKHVSVVAGWGTTSSGGSPSSTLKEVRVKTMTNSQCAQSYGSSITDNMLCASAPGKDSCQGDSGGPLFVKPKNGPWTQSGVVSFGKGCADPNYPGVYARMSKYIPWIKSMIKGDLICARMWK